MNNCEKCDFQSPQKLCLKQHTESVHGGAKKYSCVICAYKSHYKNGVIQHQRSNHDSDATKKVKRIGYLKREENTIHSRCVVNGRRRWAHSVKQKKEKIEKNPKKGASV